MSHTVAFIYLVMFTSIFLGLNVILGTTLPGFNNIIGPPKDCVFNNIPASTCSFPAFNPPKLANSTTTNTVSIPFPQCMFTTPFSCGATTIQTIQNLAQATQNGLVEVGYAIGLVPIYTFVFFNKIYMSLVLLNTVFSVINLDYGVPFLTYFMYAFVIILTMLGLAIFKPGGHGS